MKNLLWYLGFLGLLSLLYFVEGELGYLGFAAFFLYFTIYNENDERLTEYAGKSAQNAFLYVMLVGAAAIIYTNLSKNPEFMGAWFVLLFSGSIIVCAISYNIYSYLDEKKMSDYKNKF